MFGRKKMYKKGLADAMQAYEAFGKKQEEALAFMREEVRSGNKELKDALAGLGEDLNGIYQYLNAQEKAALYQLSTPMDIKELDDEEKRLLLAVLYQLAENEGSALTDDQRTYIRSVQKYLEITNPQTFADLSAIENIDSIDVQKTFLRVILEFFYLQDGDELSDEQEEIFDYFSVNKKQATIVENEVSRLFNAVGPEGVAEKYGYVPEETPADVEVEQAQSENTINDNSCVGTLSGEVIDKIFGSCHDNRFTNFNFYETLNYILYYYESGPFSASGGWFIFDKQTGEKKQLEAKLSFSKYNDPLVDGDRIIYFVHDNNKNSISEGDMWLFDLSTLQTPQKLFSIEYQRERISVCNNRIVFIDDGMPYFYDIETKKLKKIPTSPVGRGSYYNTVFAAQSGIYFSLDDHPNYKLFLYDFQSSQVKCLFTTNHNICEIYHVDGDHIYFSMSSDYVGADYGMIDLNVIQDSSKARFTTEYDVMLSSEYKASIHAYTDCLMYVARDGSIKKVNYSTGEITEIVHDAIRHDYDSGSLFRKGYSYYRPVRFGCFGGWLCYPQKGDYDKWCRVSLSSPDEIGFLPNN